MNYLVFVGLCTFVTGAMIHTLDVALGARRRGHSPQRNEVHSGLHTRNPFAALGWCFAGRWPWWQDVEEIEIGRPPKGQPPPTPPPRGGTRYAEPGTWEIRDAEALRVIPTRDADGQPLRAIDWQTNLAQAAETLSRDSQGPTEGYIDDAEFEFRWSLVRKDLEADADNERDADDEALSEYFAGRPKTTWVEYPDGSIKPETTGVASEPRQSLTELRARYPNASHWDDLVKAEDFAR